MNAGLQGAMEAKLALTEVALQSEDKLSTKKLFAARGWEERSGCVMAPNESDRATIRRRARHNGHAGDVRSFLIPSVEYAEEADLCAEMLGIASDVEEGFGAGLQQEMVEEFLVLQSEWRQFMR